MYSRSSVIFPSGDSVFVCKYSIPMRSLSLVPRNAAKGPCIEAIARASPACGQILFMETFESRLGCAPHQDSPGVVCARSIPLRRLHHAHIKPLWFDWMTSALFRTDLLRPGSDSSYCQGIVMVASVCDCIAESARSFSPPRCPKPPRAGMTEQAAIRPASDHRHRIVGHPHVRPCSRACALMATLRYCLS